ncbi:dihydrodipicolinate synthase family protein [Haloparvum alkalitolerans]|uniref:dihydrodipicolinate synthase family protein n=1 Tax=Haloparvum alkalitolerans TaxID=1042953 RepID=UPI003CEEF0A5
MELTDRLRGVTPPLVTPFSNGAVDHDALTAVVEHAVAGGVAGLFPNGTTGEFASLADAERAAVVETAVAAAPADVPVLAGVADTAVADVLAHADRAADAGADAVVVTPPYFHGPNGGPEASRGDGLRSFFETVADEATLPVFLYDIPSCTGTAIPTPTALSLAEHPNVVGLKDSSGDFGSFCRLVREAPDDFLVLQGFDNLLYPSLRVGADGGVHALSNVAPEAFADLYAAATAPEAPAENADGDRAVALHEAVGTLFDACLDGGFAPATKAALVDRGVLEDDAVRPPLSTLDDDGRRTVAAALSTLDGV